MPILPRPFTCLTAALCIACNLAGTFAVCAQPQPQPQAQYVPPVPQSRGAEADPPSRVARIADVSGHVWLYSPDAGEWVNAPRNRPVTRGDWLATEAGARAEVQLGATTVRLDAGTELEVRRLDDDHFAVQLHKGSVAIQARDDAQAGDIEVATDTGRFVLQRAGRYRFDRPSGTPGASFATVLDGQARFEGANSGLSIPAGRRAEFWLDAAGAAQYRLEGPQNDAFAVWNRERDYVSERNTDSATTARYVSPYMTGAVDLDRYGRWDTDPDYGPVWTPSAVAADWAPYSTGRWAWVQPWGWTWVDDAPWGFAPFHYGRWVQRRSSWCWVPGQRVARPVYAPALVAWVGGPDVQVSISIGGQRRSEPVVGWFPLAPREVYIPTYRSSPRYIQNINITHVTNVIQITNVINHPQAPREFRNRRVQDALTVVPAAVLSNRQPVGPAAAQLRDAPEVRGLRDAREGRGVNQGPAVPDRRTAEIRPPERGGGLIDQRGLGAPPAGVGPQPNGPPPPPGVTPPPRDGERRDASRPAPSAPAQTGRTGGPGSAGPLPPPPPIAPPPPHPGQGDPLMRALPMPLPAPTQPPRGDERRPSVRQPEPAVVTVEPARVATPPPLPAPRPATAPPPPPSPAPSHPVQSDPLMRALPMPLPSPTQPPRGDERRPAVRRPEPAAVTVEPARVAAPAPAPLSAPPTLPPPPPPRPVEVRRPAPPVVPVAPVGPVGPVAPVMRAPAAVRPAGPESNTPPEARPTAREPREAPRDDRRDEKKAEERKADPREPR